MHLSDKEKLSRYLAPITRRACLAVRASALVAVSTLTACAVAPPMQEMSDARQSVEAAKDAGAEEHAPKALVDAEILLTQAEDGIRSGDYEEAQKDALAAQEAARNALVIANVKVEQPEDILPASQPEELVVQKETSAHYTVNQKNTLWSIAARPDVYDNPYMWPLLYKKNANKIEDADLIFPAQELTIDISPTPSEVAKAIQHARHRGPWRLGETEASDISYLRR